MSDNVIPRRNNLETITPAEKAISDAMALVEKLPADPRLTDAVVLLDKARHRVGDYIDGVDQTSATPPISTSKELYEAASKPLRHPKLPRKTFLRREVYKLGEVTVAYDEAEGFKLITPAGMKPSLMSLKMEATNQLHQNIARVEFLQLFLNELDKQMRLKLEEDSYGFSYVTPKSTDAPTPTPEKVEMEGMPEPEAK